MLTRIHIAVSPDPLPSGDHKALCGKLIRNAEWVWSAEHGGTALKEIFNPFYRCKDCWKADWGGRYVYGITEKQEVARGEYGVSAEVRARED